MTFATYFNPGVSFQGGSGSSSGAASLPISGNGATITANTPLVDGTQTWNNAAVTFTSLKMNITDTASNAASLLMDLQVGGASQLKVSKGGVVTSSAVSASATGPAITFGSAANTGIGSKSSTGAQLTTWIDGTLRSQWAGNVMRLRDDQQIGWASGDPSGTSQDTIIRRRGVANLAIGTLDAAAPVAQTLSVQSVSAGTSNTAGANLTITGSQGTGTGTGGSIIFQVAPAGSTGTAQNALAAALTIAGNRTVILGAAYTVATLPAAGTQGRRAWVTDATVPTFLGTLTGGGAVVCPVFDNGTAWVSA